jgi:hypothetical protein
VETNFDKLKNLYVITDEFNFIYYIRQIYTYLYYIVPKKEGFAFEFIEEGLEAEEIYMSLLIKNYNGKNIEIKITDIEKEGRYKKRLAEIREELLDIALDKEK